MIELQMSFDYNANILYVTIIQGKNLKTFSGTNVAKPDAFILGYLLPKRTMATMRKTCYVMESSSPFWNQTFVYPDITLGQLRSQYLEISAWSHNYHAASEFLGEIMLDLSGKFNFEYIFNRGKYFLFCSFQKLVFLTILKNHFFLRNYDFFFFEIVFY